MKAAVYIRVSTDEQTEYSPKSQQEMIARYAAERGIELSEAHIYVDEGISGRSAKGRTAFQKMISAAAEKPRPFDLVLVWKFSRFARNRKDSIVYKAMLKQYGIDVVSVSEPIGSDSTAVLMEALLEAMDEYYSLNLAQEVRRGMEQKFREGGVVSRPPFGYRVKAGVFVQEATEAQAVEALFQGAAAGQTLRALSEMLAGQGICRADGHLLTPRAIGYILQNPIYCGKAGRTLEGSWVVLPANQPPIVSEALFEAVQNRFSVEKSAQKPTYEKKQSNEWMLRGIAVCSSCGALLARAGKGGLQCSHYAKGSCKISHWMNEERLNRALIQALGETALRGQPTGKAGWVRCESQSRASDDAKRRRETALRRAERAYLMGVTELDEYAAQKKMLSKIGREEKADGTPLPDFFLSPRLIASFLGDPRFTPAEKRQVAGQLFQQVIYDRKERTLTVIWKKITTKKS